MTTPVFSDASRGAMQFFMGKDVQGQLPAPTDARVEVKTRDAGVYAVRKFGGKVGAAEASREADELKRALRRDGIDVAGEAWTLAQYNDPGTPGWQRRNEVLVRVEGYDLWR